MGMNGWFCFHLPLPLSVLSNQCLKMIFPPLNIVSDAVCRGSKRYAGGGGGIDVAVVVVVDAG